MLGWGKSPLSDTCVNDPALIYTTGRTGSLSAQASLHICPARTNK